MITCTEYRIGKRWRIRRKNRKALTQLISADNTGSYLINVTVRYDTLEAKYRTGSVGTVPTYHRYSFVCFASLDYVRKNSWQIVIESQFLVGFSLN
jgi:hypothetical protein